MKRRLYKAILPVCALFYSILSPVHGGPDIQVGNDLQADGRLASERQLPILLTFTAIDCDYCDLLEEEFLRPMLLSGEYTDRVIIRKIVLDNGSRLTDFSGRQRDATALSTGYRVFVTPTLLFVDGSGQERAARMLGINTLEMFGGYLDNCIETALLEIRGLDPPNRPITCLPEAAR